MLLESLHKTVWKTCGNRRPEEEKFRGGDFSTIIHSTESYGTEEKWKTEIQISEKQRFSGYQPTAR
jgi:hypothetical protein